jgi:site-specific DNA-methyltransferase (adenine-specific)/site-specific DNA-methyltransferase (cytosine-N4-specific)
MPKTKARTEEATYRLLPPLDPETYAGLKANIALNGVLVPIVRDQDGLILDGFARAQIAGELGYECPTAVQKGLSEPEKRSLVRALNLARRQLDQRSKRAIIADQLRETPGLSNRRIARSLGVHHDTVANVRHELASTGQIDQLDRLVGRDGRVRPANGTIPESDLKVSGQALTQDLDEEAILRAAAEIRQRRVADRLSEIQNRREQARPRRTRRKGCPILHGDCLDLIPTLEDGSVGLVVTSPPDAEQRAGHYEGIPEEVYAEFTVRWMEALRPKLTPDGSALLVIRPHLRQGVLSDYVLRTRLALREAGWYECEELVWYKPDAPPLGSLYRPRRTWESVLWYGRSPQPYCDLKACGRESGRLGFEGSLRFGVGGPSPLNGGQGVGRTSGVARIGDVLVAPVGENEPGVDHPAVFPLALADQLVRTFSTEGDLVLDPFCGSGQTLLAAKACKRRYLGIEREERYVRIALERLGR